MTFELPNLPYPIDALTPHISVETLEFHHGKHHRTYVEKLNGLVKGTPDENKSLTDLIKTSKGGIFNNAAQCWNHDFYWKSMAPKAGGEPKGAIGEAINKSFGNFADFKKQFSDAAVGQFGSGWAWLVDHNGQLKIVTTGNADNPMQNGQTPLLTCDVWEHAYYVDYRNARPKYVEAWWNLTNWAFAEENLKAARR